MTSNLSSSTGTGNTDAGNANAASPRWRDLQQRAETGELPVDRLHRELLTVQNCETDDATNQRTEQLVSSAISAFAPGATFEFDRGLVVQNLEEILVLLIALRDQETNGKQLIEDLSTLFDAGVSPGTVYPRLHDLEDDGILQVHELIRTKEYQVGDTERARAQIENAMYQHLVLGSVFAAALDDL